MKTFDIHKWQADQVRESFSDNAKSVTDTMTEIMYFSAEEMEEFFLKLSNYFQKSGDSISNMNTDSIARHIYEAHLEVKNRTGN